MKCEVGNEDGRKIESREKGNQGKDERERKREKTTKKTGKEG